MKIALVVGHSDLHKGASMTKPFNYVQEYEFNTVLAAMIQSRLIAVKVGCEVFLRDFAGVIETYENVKRWKPDMSVELHFNASTSKKPSGSEVLYGPQEGAALLATNIQDWMSSSLQNKHRGIKPLSNGSRGWTNLSRLEVPQVMIEPFFGSNMDECQNALANMSEIAGSVADGCIQYWVPRPITRSLQ